MEDLAGQAGALRLCRAFRYRCAACCLSGLPLRDALDGGLQRCLPDLDPIAAAEKMKTPLGIHADTCAGSRRVIIGDPTILRRIAHLLLGDSKTIQTQVCAADLVRNLVDIGNVPAVGGRPEGMGDIEWATRDGAWIFRDT